MSHVYNFCLRSHLQLVTRIFLYLSNKIVGNHKHIPCFLNFNLFPYQNYNRLYKLWRRNIDSQSVLAIILRLNCNLVEPNPLLIPKLQSSEILELEVACWNSFCHLDIKLLEIPGTWQRKFDFGSIIAKASILHTITFYTRSHFFIDLSTHEIILHFCLEPIYLQLFKGFSLNKSTILPVSWSQVEIKRCRKEPD